VLLGPTTPVKSYLIGPACYRKNVKQKAIWGKQRKKRKASITAGSLFKLSGFLSHPVNFNAIISKMKRFPTAFNISVYLTTEAYSLKSYGGYIFH